MNIGLSGKVGLRAILYYVATTIFAVILGIVLVVTIRPGETVDATGHVVVAPHEGPKKNVSTADTLMDLLRNSFPPNIIQATLQQYHTELIYPGEDVSPPFLCLIVDVLLFSTLTPSLAPRSWWRTRTPG